VFTKCPKCHFENPDDTVYCGKCAAPLRPSNDISLSRTETLRTPKPTKTIAGKYKILKELGRGGMGVVYKAKDSRLKRIVALKFLPPDLTKDPGAKERFIQEAQAAAALDHPNICTVYEVDKLKVDLLGEEKERIVKHHTVNLEAYNLYLKGLYFFNKRTEEGMRKGMEYFQQAIENDPTYPLAYVGLADSFNLLGTYDVFPPNGMTCSRIRRIDGRLV